MGTTRRLRSLVGPSGDQYWLARVVVAVRVAVVVSIVVLVAVGPEWLRRYPLVLGLVLAAALGYSAVLMARPSLELRRTRYAWLVSTLDATLTLALIWLTGGTSSPVVVVLVLVVVASAARLTLPECLVLAGLVGVGYLAVVLVSGPRDSAGLPAATQGLWWALYLVFIAVLTGGLSVLVEREHRSRVRALVEAEAEHAAAEEERDLRARLLRSYEAQQEGLQVLLHEFRTPVASLGALVDSAQLEPVERETTIRLAGRHARHLSDMLDALSDVNLSRQPAFSSGRIRRIDLVELVNEAGDAAGVRPPRLHVTTSGDVSAIQVDAQGLRRILTNLLENAARHGRGRPIDVECERRGDQLSVAIVDRGPGVPQENLGELTTKFVSLSDRRGTAGLGLWIVAQIVDALGGTLQFSTRGEGGLTASFTVPVG
ncbi:HAMP domain-containing histidine kinase [Mycolicibacterium pulveris]|uniref:histidine kinase n=1 Tax=Mycolicibacterium pulveris TaxID=36813 RepID=A0A7I7UK45_MYCPV|nr:HAMP domain-containing sensor histidine kinase [Mycolicibacterium pulveris]MCV6980260.1 HAMP domain-containing histidine kinase [Mycolicibacterium pulveris]BBY81647.1 two-component sensor histidine kinase [Mycolicibacterium pulveris]